MGLEYYRKEESIRVRYEVPKDGYVGKGFEALLCGVGDAIRLGMMFQELWM